MSDGHFNRSLLPHTEFRNGFRTAQTRTRIIAQEAFKEWLSQYDESLTEEQIQEELEKFGEMMQAKIK